MAALWITEDDLDEPTNPDAAEAARAASMLMFQLSGRKYLGVREVTEFYERPATCATLSSVRGRTSRDLCEGSCTVHRRQRLRLRRAPVVTVTQVVVRWEDERRIVTPDEYQVVDRKYLRRSVNASWSLCSDLEVTYTGGTRVPEAGLRAARLLGNQLLKARCDPSNCALPDRITSVTRQGVSFTVLDAQDFLKDGRTGIYEVDLFLKAVNPDNARKRAGVFSPDTIRAGRVTSTS